MSRPLLPPRYLLGPARSRYPRFSRGSPRRPVPLGRRNRAGTGRRAVRRSLAQQVNARFLGQLPGGALAEQLIAQLPLPDAAKDVLRNPILGQLEIAADLVPVVGRAIAGAAEDVAGAIGGAFSNTFRYDEQGGDVSPPNDASDRFLA